MAKSNLRLNPISNIFSAPFGSRVLFGQIGQQVAVKAATGLLSLEQATIKWNNPEFLNSIFALVIKKSDGEQFILKKNQYNIGFKYKNSCIYIVLDDDLGSSYEVKAILCKDRSGLEIADGKIRHMNSGDIYELAHGLKVFVKTEKDIQKAEAKTDNNLQNLQGKKSKHLLGHEDVRLLNEAIAGNVNSLAMYFHRLRNRLIGYAKISSIDEAKSEDAVQEAFIVIFNKMAEGNWDRRDFKSPFQLAKFIGSVIRNRAFNIGKLACNRHETSLDDGLEEIDPDKQEHHISAKNIRLDSDMELAADPQGQLETFDALLFLEAVGKYIAQNNTQSLSILSEFIAAHLGSDGEFVERDFSRVLGITSPQLATYLDTARFELESVGLGKRAMKEGIFPSSITTIRLVSSYQYK